MTNSLTDLRQQEYDVQQEINRLELQLKVVETSPQSDVLLSQLKERYIALNDLESRRTESQTQNAESGLLLEVQPEQPKSATRGSATRGGTARGQKTTKLEAKVELRMMHVPTAIYHLLNRKEHPLIASKIQNHSNETKRIRVTSFIEGYSASAIETIELPANEATTIQQLPTLFPGDVRRVTELTRATLNVQIEDLDPNGGIERHVTEPIWLLSRNSAPLYVRDPATGKWNDLTRYFGAFVTPNESTIMAFLRTAATRHPEGMLHGYQDGHDVESQVRAIFTALKDDVELTYVNSTVNFNPEQSSRTQRVRLPRQSLSEGQANCIDGTLLFASLLEAASLNPAIVVVRNHVLVAWQRAKTTDAWSYLETTKINNSSFEEAKEAGQKRADTFEELATLTKDPTAFTRWSVRDLRTKFNITPLE